MEPVRAHVPVANGITRSLVSHDVRCASSSSDQRHPMVPPDERPNQRLPARSTGPPRFMGVPTAPTPGVTAARATGRGRSTTPALTVQPAGYATYWQYTTAPACSVLAATSPATSRADNAIESFILVSLSRKLQIFCPERSVPLLQPLGTIRSTTARLTMRPARGLMQIKGALSFSAMRPSIQNR
jgi:hypothetical protein